jgi:hypothetical protein
MKKNHFILIALLLISNISKGQTFTWAFNNSSSGSSLINNIVTDAVGNTYAVGTFTGVTTFGSTNITSLGSFDAFVSKRSPTGTVLWTVRVGGTAGDIAYGVSLDTAGNAIVVGEFGGTATFGTTTFNSNGGLDVFVMKVSAAGSIVWASRFGGTGSESARDVCVTKSNIINIVGQFTGTATFGSTNYPSNGGTDIFLARVTAIGGLLSSARFGGTSSEYGNAIAVDTLSRVLFTGYYAGSISFGSTTLTSAGGNDIFVVSTSATFNVSWANSYGGIGNDRGSGIASDKALNIFVTGSFSNSMTIGSTNLVSAGVTDAFVTKLNIQGTPQWALKMGGNTFDDGKSVSVNDNGDIVCTGEFSNAVVFGNTQKISLGARDIFIVKFNQNGSYSWVNQAGGTNDDYGNAVSINDSNVFIGGEFEGGATFGNITLTTSTGLTGDSESYTAAMGLCPTSYAIINASACDNYTLNSQTYTTSGTYQQTLISASGCDSIITLNLSIGRAGDANLQWANSASATQSENRSVAIDANGDVVTTGWFDGTSDFNPGAGVFSLTSVGDQDIFITKLNASGGFVWAKSIGSIGIDKGLTITTDAAGNIYVAGTFFGTADFNPGVGINNLTSTGDADVFVLKLDAAGNYLWAKQLGGTLIDVVSSIALDAAGNILLGGSFQGTSDFDPSSGTLPLTSVGSYDVFLLKLNTAGDLVWAKQAGDTGTDLLYSFSMDVSGNIYATGQFAGTVDFDPSGATSSLTSNGNLDVFIWKLNSTGDYKFVKQIGSTQGDYGSRITAMQSGYIHVTGVYKGIADFDPGVGVYNMNVSTAIGDVFVLKLDTAGNFVWAYNVGGPSEDYSSGIVVDGGGNVYVSGTFSGATVDFNSGAGVAYLNSAGSSDIFLMKLNQGGTFEWAKDFGSTFMDTPYDLVLSNNSTLYMVGSFWYTVDFDPGAGETILTSSNSSDAFVAKFGSCCVSSASGISPNVCGSYTSPSGNYSWTTSGTYYDTIANATGCDSVITIQLTIRQNSTGTINQSICQGQSYFFNGANRTAQGAYLDTLVNAVGCDSMLTLNLTVKQNSTGTINQSICQGQSYFFNGVNRTAQGAYLDTLVNAVGCDSVLTLNLTVKQNSTGTINHSICQGQSYFFNGVNRTAQGAYLDTLVNSMGCDSVLTLNLTVNSLPNAVINGPTTICSGLSATLTASGGGTYTWSNNGGGNAQATFTPTQTTTYTVTVTGFGNCTATATQAVSVQSAPTATITGPTSVCAGGSVTLTANGGNSYTWANGLGANAAITVSLSTATIYTVTVTVGANCTASVSQAVSVKQPSASTLNQTICSGKTFAFNGQQLTQGGTYRDTIPNVAGCDSIITLNLSIALILQGSFNQTICSGSSYTFNNQILTQAGAYKDTVQTSGGCDSIITLNLSIAPVLQESFNQTICFGGSYTFNNQVLTQAGEYKDTVQTSGGCDSIITLNLSIAPVLQGSFNQTICAGSSYTFNNQVLSQAGAYKDTIQNGNGCDSIVTLNLSVGAILQTSFNDSICSGDNYLFNGLNLTQGGQYADTLQTAGGCDSIITFTLVVNALPQPVITKTADTLTTQTYAAYHWLKNDTAISGANAQSFTLTQTGSYRVVVTDEFGCSDTSSVWNVVSVDVKDVFAAAGIKLYPNPNSGVFILEFTDEVIRKIEITDAVGTIVQSSLNTEKQNQITLNEKAAGVYFVNIEQNGQHKTMKFVLMK